VSGQKRGVFGAGDLAVDVADCFGRIVALRPMQRRIMIRPSRESQKRKLQASEAPNLQSLQYQNRPRAENRLQLNGLNVVHGRLRILRDSSRGA